MTESHSENLPVTGWQVLGELELTTGSNVEQQIHAWLMELLLPLRLYKSFLNKLLASANEYTSRALHATAQAGHGHVHLAILVQQEHGTYGNPWGFFRVEKNDNPEQDSSHPDHVVEFYLYREGH